MAKLNFYYGAMASGKSLECIRVIHNYREHGANVLVLKPTIDVRSNAIHSRAGLSVPCRPLSEKQSIYELITEKVDVIIVDEAQFLSAEQVWHLRKISILDNVPVICFGLKVDYKGRMFEGTQRLFELADALTPIKGLCACGSLSAHNVRLDKDGKVEFSGDQISIGFHYRPLCQKCFFATIENNRENGE